MVFFKALVLGLLMLFLILYVQWIHNYVYTILILEPRFSALGKKIIHNF
jgi:hypothetical protein